MMSRRSQADSGISSHTAAEMTSSIRRRTSTPQTAGKQLAATTQMTSLNDVTMSTPPCQSRISSGMRAALHHSARVRRRLENELASGVLPSPRRSGGGDLPSRGRCGGDLPFPRRPGAGDLPSPRRCGGDPPSPRRPGAGDLPSPRRSGDSDLPYPRRTGNLPSPRRSGGGDLPSPESCSMVSALDSSARDCRHSSSDSDTSRMRSCSSGSSQEDVSGSALQCISGVSSIPAETRLCTPTLHGAGDASAVFYRSPGQLRLLSAVSDVLDSQMTEQLMRVRRQLETRIGELEQELEGQETTRRQEVATLRRQLMQCERQLQEAAHRHQLQLTARDQLVTHVRAELKATESRLTGQLQAGLSEQQRRYEMERLTADQRHAEQLRQLRRSTAARLQEAERRAEGMVESATARCRVLELRVSQLQLLADSERSGREQLRLENKQLRSGMLQLSGQTTVVDGARPVSRAATYTVTEPQHTSASLMSLTQMIDDDGAEHRALDAGDHTDMEHRDTGSSDNIDADHYGSRCDTDAERHDTGSGCDTDLEHHDTSTGDGTYDCVHDTGSGDDTDAHHDGTGSGDDTEKHSIQLQIDRLREEFEMRLTSLWSMSGLESNE